MSLPLLLARKCNLLQEETNVGNPIPPALATARIDQQQPSKPPSHLSYVVLRLMTIICTTQVRTKRNPRTQKKKRTSPTSQFAFPSAGQSRMLPDCHASRSFMRSRHRRSMRSRPAQQLFLSKRQLGVQLLGLSGQLCRVCPPPLKQPGSATPSWWP